MVGSVEEVVCVEDEVEVEVEAEVEAEVEVERRGLQKRKGWNWSVLEGRLRERELWVRAKGTGYVDVWKVEKLGLGVQWPW